MQRYELPQIIKMAFHKRNSTQVLAFLKYSMHSSTNVRVHYELNKKKGAKMAKCTDVVSCLTAAHD